jgi:hypothetical protein
LEHVVAKSLVLRHSEKEALQYIQIQTGLSITERGYYMIKKRIKTKGRKWLEQLRHDQDSFLYEFRQRYETT